MIQHMDIDTFRAAGRSDVEAITLLVNKAYRPQPDAAGWTHEADLVSGNRTSVSQVAEIMAQPDAVMLVGIKNSEIITCVHIQKDDSTSHIGMLAVNPLVQGAGVGKQMLVYAENYAGTVLGSKKFVMLVVSARTELISFYLRRGYQKTGAVMDYPLSAGAGTPKQAALKIEVLEKRAYIPVAS